MQIVILIVGLAALVALGKLVFEPLLGMGEALVITGFLSILFGIATAFLTTDSDAWAS